MIDIKDLREVSEVFAQSLFLFDQNRTPFIKETYQDIWGKEIRRVYLKDSNYVEERYELENWYIPVIIKKSDVEDIIKGVSIDFKTNILDSLRDKILHFEVDKINNEKIINTNSYLVYQLCSWQFLTNDLGNIFVEEDKDNYKITLVKYAKILPILN